MIQTLKLIIARVLRVWMKADGFGLSATISFFAIFSLAPTIALGTYISARLIGEERAKEGVENWLEGFIGTGEADEIVDLVVNVGFQQTYGLPIILAVVIFLWASSLVFVRLRLGIDRILAIESGGVPITFGSSVKARLRAMGVTILTATILAFGVVGIAVIGLWGFLSEISTLGILFQKGATLMLVGIITFLIIRLLPNHRLGIKGELVAVIVFVATFQFGKNVLNWYLSKNEILTAYGAASTLVVALVWIYYNAQVFFFSVTVGSVIDHFSEKTQLTDTQ